MSQGTVFPLFIRTVYQPDGSAKSAFLADVDNLTQAGLRKFESFGTEAQRQLERALSLPRTAGGSLDLGASQLKAAADAQQARAIAAREVANATALAAKEEGDYSQQARLSVAATQALAIEEERAAAKALAHAAAVEQVQERLSRQASATDVVTSATRRNAVANDNLTKVNGAQRQGMQQLGYQLGDVATMYALGSNAGQIFASQLGQTVQAVQLMSGGTSRLAGFLGGPWGIAISTAAIALSPFISQMFASADAAEKQKDSLAKVAFASSAVGNAQSILGGVMDMTTGKITAQTGALIALARAQLVVGRLESQTRQAAAGGDISKYTREGMGRPTRDGAIQPFSTAETLANLRNDVGSGKKTADDAIRSLQGLEKAGAITKSMFSDLAKSYANWGVEAANQKVFEDAEKLLNGTGGKGLLTPDKPSRARAAAMSEAAKAAKQQNDETERFIANLQSEAEKIGLTAAQLRALEVGKAKDAALTDAQRQAIEKYSEAREAGLRGQSALAALMNQARAVRELNKADADKLAQLDKEFALLGKVGPERERAALALEKDAFMAAHVALGLEGATAAWLEYWQTSTRNIDAESRLEKDAKAAERARDAIAALAQDLQNLGGAGGILGSILQATQGNFGAIGGPAGALLGVLNRVPVGTNADGSARYLADRFREIFDGKGSPFGKTMGELLQGAGTGVIAGTAAFGNSGGAQIGSGIGGALGETAFKALAPKLFSKLGSFAGPLGSIAGGLIGGLVGGLFKKTTYGTANLGGGSVALSGNRDNLKTGAGNAGNGIMTALDNIASQLGGSLGGFNTSIGVTDGKWNVSTIGTTGRLSAKKQKGTTFDFGEDQASAIKFAIADAIKDGAITGLRAATQALLNKGSDIEAQLKKALDFESVFSRLKVYSDPVGAALDTLDREFSRLQDIFTEAGANAAEFADLEKLYGLERAKAIKEAMEQTAGALRSFLSDLSLGDNGLSLRDRRAAALEKYNPLAARVRSGDASAFDEYSQAARDLLDLQRQISGSQGDYFTLFNEVRTESQTALDAMQATADASTGRDSPFSGSPTSTVADNASVVSAIDAQTGALLEGLGARLDLLNSNLVAGLEARAANAGYPSEVRTFANKSTYF